MTTEPRTTTQALAALDEWRRAYEYMLLAAGEDPLADEAHGHSEDALYDISLTIRDALSGAGQIDPRLVGAARFLQCNSCGMRPDDPEWKWALGEGAEQGHVIDGSVPDLCGPVSLFDPTGAGQRDARVAVNVVGSCDWGNCDGETVGVRLDQDGEWLAVCAQHSEICRAMDAIWRLTCLPFSDNDRRQIQGIALAWIDGQGPKPGSQVAQWLAALETPAPTPGSGEAQ